MNDVPLILSAIEQGEPHAAEQLLPLVYRELRELAARMLTHEKPGQILQATALVHEAFIRLVDSVKVQHWDSRGHFYAAAAEAMRRILIEHARERKRLKRGGGRNRVNLTDADLVFETSPDDLLDLDEALKKLALEDPLAAQLASLRYFGGLSVDQAAEVIGLSRSTSYEQWAYARAWLRCQLQRDENSPRA